MKPTIRTKSLLTLLAAGVCSASANAAALIYEPFDMDTGNLGGASSPGSSGLSGAWSVTGSAANNQVTSGSLSYGDLATSGNSLATTASNGSEDGEVLITNVLSTNSLLTDGNTLWFSLIIQGGVGSNAHSGFAFGTDGIAGAFNGVSMNSSGDGFGVYYQGGTARATSWQSGARTGNGSDFSIASATLLVGELIWTDAGETINFYTPNTELVRGDVVSTYSTGGNISQGSFDTISYTTRGSSGGDLFDEIRFGASYADVSPIPEPSAALLGGLGCLLLLRRRR